MDHSTCAVCATTDDLRGFPLPRGSLLICADCRGALDEQSQRHGRAAGFASGWFAAMDSATSDLTAIATAWRHSDTPTEAQVWAAAIAADEGSMSNNNNRTRARQRLEIVRARYSGDTFTADQRQAKAEAGRPPDAARMDASRIGYPPPMPSVPTAAPAGPSWAVWALGLAVLLSLLGTALATVYARSAPMVDAVSDDGGGRVP